MGMQKVSIEALARQQLKLATDASSGRSASTIFGGHEKALRQTLLALVKDTTLAEHESPGEATVYVVEGRVQLHAAGATWEARTGDLLIMPSARHSIDALEDSVLLMTVAKTADNVSNKP
ncbi:MAG TPA: cupin domain-containing protein [Glaciihabitans sp.]|jgi:quercetin dioxygenase-like cupin family protein|nr:cupin domain-containing protein [Glaciihabitans sp.]